MFPNRDLFTKTISLRLPKLEFHLSADELAELLSMALYQDFSENIGLRHDTLPVLRILKDMVNAGLVKKDTLIRSHDEYHLIH